MERAASDGKRVRALEERPDLDIWQGIAWQCFQECGTCRAIGGAGPGPIPWSAVHQWAGAHSVTDPDDFDDLLYLVCELDAVWLRDVAAKMKPGDAGSNETRKGQG